jgi:hypothetical protein
MFEFIHKLYSLLNQFKGFEAGYSTQNTKAMIIKYGDKNYKITVEELGDGDIGIYVNKL